MSAQKYVTVFFLIYLIISRCLNTLDKSCPFLYKQDFSSHRKRRAPQKGQES